ncbi:hypothetical protein FALBO_2268 [Fusarium albosuccineum]|uniref:F-box domain-containing protein n=1 Tax=Fusarium albosuccineum TaxID=1237068 RepID=A0A8H4LNI1_9HYPO|nr:hypothetical protein FALBO_2268 [Fusarium albosuccineum]
MGGQVYCHICGVGFNISRDRTDKEPRSAAWGEDGRAFAEFDPEDCPEKGCLYVARDPSGDDSTAESEAGFSEPNIFLPDTHRLHHAAHNWEHIPGPECDLNRAYNGHFISAEAMRGRTTLQCLVRKPDDWEPEPDDEAFEASGHFFLSGLGDYMPDKFDSGPTVFPERHSTSMPRAENWFNELFVQATESSMPFHPTCLEIFKRASLHRYGVVDIECLTQWWGLEAAYDYFIRFPRHQAVLNGRGDEDIAWQYYEGEEFLAANPCFVPGLQALLSSTRRSKKSLKKYGNNYSELIPKVVSTGTAPADLFSRLPEELRMMILMQLSSKDIANLRLASRTFLLLPSSLFYRLVVRDMPWLYEAWSSLPISFWATTTKSEEKSRQRAWEAKVVKLRNKIEILKREATDSGDPKFNKSAIKAAKKKLRELPDLSSVSRPATSPVMLSRTKTDWCRLKILLSKNLKTVPGLQNRRRIWNDCQEILNRVDRYRAQGKIRPGEAVDVAEVARQTRIREEEEARRARARWA